MEARNPIFLLSYIGQAVSVLVCVAGLALALSRWARHPQASLWAALGFGLLLLSRLAGVAFSIMLPMIARNLGGGSPIVSINLGVNFLAGLVSAAGLALLTVAVFIGRQTQGSRRE